MQQAFSSHTLAEVFRDLYLGERSGVLLLTRGDQEKRIYFDRGMILHAESNAEDEELGRRLVGEGKISPGREAHRQVALFRRKPWPCGWIFASTGRREAQGN